MCYCVLVPEAVKKPKIAGKMPIAAPEKVPPARGILHRLYI